jgi:hypothetical protein
MGGSGGVGGLGGNGGRGGNGAQIVIHTNDPSVLMLIDVDVSGGKGGTSGPHGLSGEGGDGGEGGEGGNPGYWMADVVKVGPKGMAITSKEKVFERSGRRGKRGKRGKSGKVQKAKPTRPGKDGEAGKVSFCLYNSGGLVESAGTPYHLMLPKRLAKTLVPVSYLDPTATATSNTSLFLYGGLLKYGPLSPVNIGGLTCPTSEMEGFLIVPGSGSGTGAGGRDVVSTTQVQFPPIPRSQLTSYGELPPGEAKSLEITVPDLTAECFATSRNRNSFDCAAWPWPSLAHQLPPVTGLFSVRLTVEDVPFTGSYEAGEMISSKQFPVTIDYPLKLLPSPAPVPGTSPNTVTTLFQAPAHICVGDTQQHDVAFLLANKLTNTAFTAESLSRYKCVLRVAGFRCRPTLSGSLIARSTAHPQEPRHGNYLLDSYELPLPLLPSGGQNRLAVQLSLSSSSSPTVTATAPSAPLPPPPLGSMIFIRPELYYDSVLLETFPPSLTRVIPDPLPTTAQQQSVTSLDILIFTHALLGVEDYSLLQRLFALLDARVHFVDCSFYPSSSVPLAAWERFKGKATILWLPRPENLHSLPSADLQAHLECGGSLICSLASSFRWNKKPTIPPEKPTRRCVMVPPDLFQLTELAQTESLETVTGNKQRIRGKVFPSLVLCLLSSMSSQDKLQYFLQHRSVCDTVLITDTVLENHSVIPGGCLPCFSSAPKILPLESSPLSLRDCLFAALRTDIEIDLHFYPKHGNNSLCYCLQELLLFASSPPALAAADYQGYLHAILLSAHITDSELHNGGAHQKNWKVLKAEVVKLLKKSLVSSKASAVDPLSSAQRIGAVEIITARVSTIARQHRLNDKAAFAFNASPAPAAGGAGSPK